MLTCFGANGMDSRKCAKEAEALALCAGEARTVRTRASHVLCELVRLCVTQASKNKTQNTMNFHINKTAREKKW